MQHSLHVPGAAWLDEATWPQDKVQHDGLELLTFVLALFLSCGIEPRMRKRDVSSALRRVPVLAWHVDLAWVV